MNTQLHRMFSAALTLCALCFSSASFAQLGSVVFNSPLVVGDKSTTIGAVTCAFSATDISKASCTVKLTAANWCVKAASASATPTTAARSSGGVSSSDDGGGRPPVKCDATVVAAFTLPALCRGPSQPYNISIMGSVFQRKPECKKREGESLDKDGKGEGRDVDNDCKDDEDYNSKGRDGKGMSSSGEKKDKDDKEGAEHSGSGGSGSSSVPFQIKGQLPCQIPEPT